MVRVPVCYRTDTYCPYWAVSFKTVYLGTRPNGITIINFPVYCNRRIVFHKSIDASNKIHDANYVEVLMDLVIEEVGCASNDKF